jgi:hypothetical protein
LENGNLENGKEEIRIALKVVIREVDCERERQNWLRFLPNGRVGVSCFYLVLCFQNESYSSNII